MCNIEVSTKKIGNGLIQISLGHLLVAVYCAVSQIELSLGISRRVIVLVLTELIGEAHWRAVPGVGAAISSISLVVLVDRVEFAFRCRAEIILTHFVHVR